MKKPCNCNPPPPRPKKGPSEYIPSRTYPDTFDYMMYGGAPMHRNGCCGPWTPVAPCCPPGPQPEPPPPEPGTCPPKIYRNPPDVELIAGRNISLEVEKDDFTWKYTVSTEADKTQVLAGDHITINKVITDEGSDYTVNAVQFPVVVDGSSDDVLYGDGTPENPLGVYDFVGASALSDGSPGTVPAPSKGEQDNFLRGDGSWANARTEVRAGENASVDKATAVDGHTIYTVNADGKPQVQANWTQTDEGAVDFIRNKPGNFAGATAQAAGAYGFVPPPAAGDQEKFLCGNGTWANVDNTRECTALEMDSWIDEVEYG